MVEEGTHEWEVAGSNPAAAKRAFSREKMRDLRRVTDRWGPPRFKKLLFFRPGFMNFWNLICRGGFISSRP
jgi:hypothetical protein